MTSYRWVYVAAALLTTGMQAEVMVNGRPSVVLESASGKLVIDLGGGSIVDFHMGADGLNPLRWIGPDDVKVTLRPMAHFLCLDHWGQASAAESRNGMPFHGEASRVRWNEVRVPARGSHAVESEMNAILPIAGLSVRRIVKLSNEAPVFQVSETVTNDNKLGRIYNMVQHATIGPPFLDENTIVDSNARRGLMQSSPLPNPEQPEIQWPNAINKGKPVDLRHLTTDPDPNVCSFTIDGDLGWVTAVNPQKELLLGYIWKTSDYPWLNIWRHVQDGKPLARGLEFGTTGLHQPFKILTAKPLVFGKPTFTYLDASEAVTRAYTAFQIKIPRDFRGVEQVAYRGGRIVIRERERGRELTVSAGAF
jgi:hypothetical protein